MKSFIHLLRWSVLAGGVCLLSCSKELPPETNGSFTIVSGGDCAAPCDVTFQAAQANARYEWSFPGGSPSTSAEANPTVRYGASGTYKATLIVMSEGGPKGTTRNVSVAVPKPTASFTIDRTTGPLVLTNNELSCTFRFTNRSANATGYVWSFGDGGSSTSISPTYSYSTAGTYTVRLTSSSGAGSTETTQTVIITYSPVPADASLYLNLPFASMTTVAGGSFVRGNTFIESGMSIPSNPIYPVTVSSFQLARYEVTQQQWQAVMGTSPSSFRNCPTCPVEQVSWNEVQEFLQKLKQLTGKTYRLPTEAEWEYAAGGGAGTRTRFGNGLNRLSTDDANVDWVNWRVNTSSFTEVYPQGRGIIRYETTPVGSFVPNRLGFYDMTGNVMEWCSDYYQDGYYTVSPARDPQGPSTGTNRVSRGGAWKAPIWYGQVSHRGDAYPPNTKYDNVGLRLAASL
jgi:formylglycine-generating enzyme required for sulfatase activity